MITRIREVRHARGMTLGDVARCCEPPTTAQTIGRLETGTRTVSVSWLNRIAKALRVEAKDLVDEGASKDLEVIAIVGRGNVASPHKPAIVVPPHAEDGQVAILVETGIGDYRVGDELWCMRLSPDDYANALNRDVLAPRPGGRFLFGRLINRDEERLQILPLEPGSRQQVLANPPWLAVVAKLVRTL